MPPIVTRILMILAGVITSASSIEVWNWRTGLSLLGMFVAGIAALNAPGTKAKAEEKALDTITKDMT
jgi:hypothetical protein